MINNTLVSVTSQGQITIPASFRKFFGINSGGKVVVGVEGDKITLQKPNDVFSRLGVHKDKKLEKTSFDEVLKIEEKAFEQGIKSKYEKINTSNER